MKQENDPKKLKSKTWRLTMGIIRNKNIARTKNALEQTPSQVKNPKENTETNDPCQEHPAFINQKKQKKKGRNIITIRTPLVKQHF